MEAVYLLEADVHACSMRTVPAKVSRNRSGKLGRASSFIGGSLIGVSLSVTMFVLNAGEGDGPMGLMASLMLASAGFVVHRRSRPRPGAHR